MPQSLTVGTFNANNLFSRFDFQGSLKDAVITANKSYVIAESAIVRRTYQGKVIREKPDAETRKLAERILAADLDVLALQEVEDIDTLKNFVHDRLEQRYPYMALHEGNDPRLIDVALVSKLPLGAMTSWQHAVHPRAPDVRVFGRDLVEIEILSADRSRRLLSVFNTHLKSNLVAWNAKDKQAEARNNFERRRRQAEVIASILAARGKLGGPFILVGDMNDVPESDALAPLRVKELGLIDGLADVTEDHPVHNGPTDFVRWTHRYKASGVDPEYLLYDQVWLSPPLASSLVRAQIARRTHLLGDGTDHDLALVELRL